MKNLRPHQIALLLAGLATLVAWVVPIVGKLLLPVQYLNTQLHELCHALMAIASGGQVEAIHVYSNGSGVTPVAGGALILVASAGYVGSAIGGAAIVLFSRTETGARATLRVLAVILLCSLIFWVRDEGSGSVGLLTAAFWILALGALSILRGGNLLFAAQFLGLQQCLSSFLSLFTLVQISSYGEKQSDAGILQEATHIPAILWSVAWCAISLALVTVAFRKAWAEPHRQAGSP